MKNICYYCLSAYLLGPDDTASFSRIWWDRQIQVSTAFDKVTSVNWYFGQPIFELEILSLFTDRVYQKKHCSKARMTEINRPYFKLYPRNSFKMLDWDAWCYYYVGLKLHIIPLVTWKWVFGLSLTKHMPTKTVKIYKGVHEKF